MKKEKFKPLNGLAIEIRDILNKKLDSPREGIVTGVTKSAVELEEYFKKEMLIWLKENVIIDGNPELIISKFKKHFNI